jgi:toxin HigB-1
VNEHLELKPQLVLIVMETLNLRCSPDQHRVAIMLTRGALHATISGVIKSFRHKGLEQFFKSGSKKGIQPKHAEKLSLQLDVLNEAERPEAMNLPGWRLHSLAGELEGHWAVKVSGNWRLTFLFEERDAVLVDYQDYH